VPAGSNTNPDRLDPKADYAEDNTPTLDAITQSSREKKQRQQSVLASIASEDNSSSESASTSSQPEPEPSSTSTASASDPAGLEEEASSEGAFNPVTGEINWDCPCLGGMAHGPCGEEFRTAFSCFVFSEDEPKGMDCIDKFKGMQDCFRAHPDVYAAELEGDDDEELDAGLEEERKELVKEIKERREKAESVASESMQEKRLLEDDPLMDREPLLRRSRPQSQPSPPSSASPSPPSSSEPHPSMSEDHEADASMKDRPLPKKPQLESNPEKAAKSEVYDQDLELVPKAWHDNRSGSTSGRTTEK
jgi:mitochondrial intermembrane space import and assembly protein 40